MAEVEFNRSMQRSLERVVARGVSRHYAIKDADEACAIIVDLIDASVLARRLFIDLGDGNHLSVDAAKRSLTCLTHSQQGRIVADIPASSSDDIVRHLRDTCRGTTALSIWSEVLSDTGASEGTLLTARELAERLTLRADERSEPAPSMLLKEMSHRGLAVMTQAREWTDLCEPAVELTQERLLIENLLVQEMTIRALLDEDSFLELHCDNTRNRSIVVCLEDDQIVFLVVDTRDQTSP